MHIGAWHHDDQLFVVGVERFFDVRQVIVSKENGAHAIKHGLKTSLIELGLKFVLCFDVYVVTDAKFTLNHFGSVKADDSAV